MAKEVTLVDAGTGNLRSVHKALESLGAKVYLTGDPAVVQRGSRVVLPGVGAFGDFMLGLREGGLEDAIQVVREKDIPLLGICVGMQALFEVGEELGEHRGLGMLRGRVVSFPEMPGLKVPHTGWNQILPKMDSPLLRGIRPGDYAYFNHAFYCAPLDQQDVLASTDYGLSFSSVIQQDHLFGVQFHPEKSQRIGLIILSNFLSI